MTDRKIMQKALDMIDKLTWALETHLYIKAPHDAKPLMEALRTALAQPEHPLDKKADNARELGLDYEPVGNEKVGSPCPKFWDWLPKAYNFEGSRTFSKYNMEVAFLAGKNTALAQPEPWDASDMAHRAGGLSVEQEPVAWNGDCALGHCGSPDGCDRSGCCRAAPPSKPWKSLTEEERCTFVSLLKYKTVNEILNAIEDTLRSKNT